MSPRGGQSRYQTARVEQTAFGKGGEISEDTDTSPALRGGGVGFMVYLVRGRYADIEGIPTVEGTRLRVGAYLNGSPQTRGDPYPKRSPHRYRKS